MTKLSKTVTVLPKDAVEKFVPQVKLSTEQAELLAFVANNYNDLTRENLEILLTEENIWNDVKVTFNELQRNTILADPLKYGIKLIV